MARAAAINRSMSRLLELALGQNPSGVSSLDQTSQEFRDVGHNSPPKLADRNTIYTDDAAIGILFDGRRDYWRARLQQE